MNKKLAGTHRRPGRFGEDKKKKTRLFEIEPQFLSSQCNEPLMLMHLYSYASPS
jgi:hypothetical protein